MTVEDVYGSLVGFLAIVVLIWKDGTKFLIGILFDSQSLMSSNIEDNDLIGIPFSIL